MKSSPRSAAIIETRYAKFEELYPRVLESVGEHRFRHILGVLHTAIQLAERYGEDSHETGVAALLHDYCKEWDTERLRTYLTESGWDHCPLEDKHKKIWHAWAGEVALRREFGMDLPRAGRAIRWHPTGHPEMDRLAGIVFLSDYIEPGRHHRGNLKGIRAEARRDLDKAIFMTLREKTKYLESLASKSAHPWSIEARLEYRTRLYGPGEAEEEDTRPRKEEEPLLHD